MNILSALQQNKEKTFIQTRGSSINDVKEKY